MNRADRAARACARVMLLVAGGTLAWSASFDCGKAASGREKAICGDKGLSQADEHLAKAYGELRAQMSADAAGEIQRDQREWLGWLDRTCKADVGCLTHEYESRVGELSAGVRTINGVVFFVRSRFLATKDKEAPFPGALDPGYGVGKFVWREIDRPNGEQQKWNEQYRLSVGNGDFADRDLEKTSEVTAANEKFICVKVREFGFGHGAAHPQTSVRSFTWSVSLGRELKLSDVFRQDKAWEAAMFDLCKTKLGRTDAAQALYTGDELVGGIRQSIADVHNWRLTGEALYVDFPDYAVGPHAAGMPSIQLSWSEVRAYLADGFDPAQLPNAAGGGFEVN